MLAKDLEVSPERLREALIKNAELESQKRAIKETLEGIKFELTMDGAGNGKNAEARKLNMQKALLGHQGYCQQMVELASCNDELGRVSVDVTYYRHLIMAQVARANLIAGSCVNEDLI